MPPAGYCDGTFYDEPEALRGLVPERDPRVAREVFRDILVDFPFEAVADRHNLIGMMVTPFIVPALDDNRPMAIVGASMERTGKTKLVADVWGGVLYGRRTPAMQMPTDDQETNKILVSSLLAGQSIIHFDNVREAIDSPALCSLLTAGRYQGRLLGSSKMVDIPNTLTIVATGNNLKATGELVKRSVPVTLQPQTDRPELRTDFVHPDIWGYVLENRRRIVEVILGMVLAWVDAGKPRGRVPMGGFDMWAACVGAIMELAGFDQFLANAQKWRDSADPRGADLRYLVEQWAATFHDTPVSAGKLLAIARRCELFPDVIDPSKGDRAIATAFGMRILSRHVDGIIGGWKLRKSDVTRPATYYLTAINGRAA